MCKKTMYKVIAILLVSSLLVGIICNILVKIQVDLIELKDIEALYDNRKFRKKYEIEAVLAGLYSVRVELIGFSENKFYIQMRGESKKYEYRYLKKLSNEKVTWFIFSNEKIRYNDISDFGEINLYNYSVPNEEIYILVFPNGCGILLCYLSILLNPLKL